MSIDYQRIEAAAAWHDRLNAVDPYFGNVFELRELAATAPCESLREWLYDNIRNAPERQALRRRDDVAGYAIDDPDGSQCPGCEQQCGIFCSRFE